MEKLSNPDEGRVQLCVITGMSGAGKSTAARCLEDLGYHCMDNLPLPMLRHLLADPVANAPGLGRVALVTDARIDGVADELPQLLGGIDSQSVDLVVLFLDTANRVLVRRYSETRRRHPLAEDSRVIDGIRRERELLSNLRGMADLVLETTDWTIHELRANLYREFGSDESKSRGLTVNLVSFGFKYGLPSGSDLLFDVRYLPNPYFDPELREETGLDAGVRGFLESKPGFAELSDRLLDLLLYLLPCFQAENRSYLTVAIGCTGGHHRSVALVERLADHLNTHSWDVHVEHRDIRR